MKPVILSFILTCICFQINAQSQRIGVNTDSPQATLHVAGTGSEDLLIVASDGATRIKTFKNGGTSIGGDEIPPVNGLRVKGILQPDSGILTQEKLIIESDRESIILKAGGATITMDKYGNIVIDAPANSITLSAAHTLKLSAPNLSLDGNNIDIKGIDLNLQGSFVHIKSNTSATVEANALLSLKGAIMKLNNGGRQATGIGSTTTVVGNTGVISSGGSPTVLIP